MPRYPATLNKRCAESAWGCLDGQTNREPRDKYVKHHTLFPFYDAGAAIALLTIVTAYINPIDRPSAIDSHVCQLLDQDWRYQETKSHRIVRYGFVSLSVPPVDSY